MRKTRRPRRRSKKIPRHRGGSRSTAGLRQTDRDLVPRRSPHRSEKQDHAAVGETRDAAFGAKRPEDEFGLHLRRHLPGRRKRRRPRAAFLNSEAMALHLAEISAAVAPGAHAILVLDQAGWHVSKKLSVPGNITLVLLPPKSPDTNGIRQQPTPKLVWRLRRCALTQQ